MAGFPCQLHGSLRPSFGFCHIGEPEVVTHTMCGVEHALPVVSFLEKLPCLVIAAETGIEPLESEVGLPELTIIAQARKAFHARKCEQPREAIQPFGVEAERIEIYPQRHYQPQSPLHLATHREPTESGAKVAEVRVESMFSGALAAHGRGPFFRGDQAACRVRFARILLFIRGSQLLQAILPHGFEQRESRLRVVEVDAAN